MKVEDLEYPRVDESEMFEEDSQFAIAMWRVLRDEGVDPQSAVAPFNSAF